METKGPVLVTDGITVTGEILSIIDFEDTGITTEAVTDEVMKTPNPVAGDQALFFRTLEGVLVILGCGHADLVNTVGT